MGDGAATVATRLLRGAELVFWDFDGVIKDSVEIKSRAFEQLFLPYGTELAARVRQHHETHGGVSRYEKIRVYLDWIGQSRTAARVDQFCDRFGELVVQAVIDSDWVPGVSAYLRRYHAQQAFVLVTAAPQDETQRILQALQATHWFREVHGTPTTKTHGIQMCLQRHQVSAHNALMVGDSESDLSSARANDVPFLLRRTPLNLSVQRMYSGPIFDDLDMTHE